MSRLIPTPHKFGLTPWLCDYEFLGIPRTITLYAESWQQLENDFASLKLEVVGEDLGVVDYDD